MTVGWSRVWMVILVGSPRMYERPWVSACVKLSSLQLLVKEGRFAFDAALILKVPGSTLLMLTAFVPLPQLP